MRNEEPITRSPQLPHIPVTAFSQTDLFLVLIYLELGFPQEPQRQNCSHKHGPMLTCWPVHVRPHCFIPTKACLSRLELAYFAGKISKNKLVCIGVLWELQAPSNGLLVKLNAKRQTINFLVNEILLTFLSSQTKSDKPDWQCLLIFVYGKFTAYFLIYSRHLTILGPCLVIVKNNLTSVFFMRLSPYWR